MRPWSTQLCVCCERDMKASYLLLAALVAASLGQGLCAVDVTVPESGSIVVGAVNKVNITLFCRLTVNGNLHAVTWLIADEGVDVSSAIAINSNSAGFAFSGETVENSTLLLGTNLTILELTEDMDRRVIFCGVPDNLDAANFSLRLYRPPSFMDVTGSSLIELIPGGASVVSAPPAFPTPQSFQWTTNTANQNSNSTFAYETVTFNPVQRADAGMYFLNASNYECEEEFLTPPDFNCTPSTVMIGGDTGRLDLDILFGPGIDSTEVQFAAGVGGSVTLKCGVNLTGNPTPTIAWRDNTAAFINQSGGRYTFSSAGLQLTVDNVAVADDGNWTCVLTVTNPATAMPIGVSEELRQLTVILPPDAPLNLSIVNGGVLSTAVLLEWATPSNDTVAEYRIVSLDASVNVLTGSDTTQYNVTGLLPGTEYSFTVAGVVTLLGVSEDGPPSEAVNVTTLVSGPSVMATSPPTSSGGVVMVSWSYAHTGGLPLTRVLVQYQSVPNGMLMTPLRGNVSNPLSSFTSLAVEGLIAGDKYQFSVTASNAEGSSVSVLPVLSLTVGIPAKPQVPVLVSDSGEQATLSLSTNAAGLSSPDDGLTFIVAATPISNGAPKTQTITSARYIDEQVVMFVFTGLEPGTYMFKVTAENQFGVSEASDQSGPFMIEPTSPPKSDNTAAIVGGIIGALIGLVLIVLIILVVIYIVLRMRGEGKSGTGASYTVARHKGPIVEEVEEVNIGDDLTGNGNDNAYSESKPEIHYAELETFTKKAPPAPVEVAPPDDPEVVVYIHASPQHTEESVHYATIDVALSEKVAAMAPAPEPQPDATEDMTQTSTTFV